MTLAELHERIGWQLEGRLQTRYENTWMDIRHAAPPHVCDPPEVYRRRPDPPPMPDVVWVIDYDGLDHSRPTAFVSRDECPNGATKEPVRYVRAGAVIPAEQVEWRYTAQDGWKLCGPNCVEYRIKP